MDSGLKRGLLTKCCPPIVEFRLGVNNILYKYKIVGIYIALYPDAQSALQQFVGDFARLLI